MINLMLIILFSFLVNPNAELIENEITIEYSTLPDQDYYMSLLTDEEGHVCFRCELPGSECSNYPYTCFEQKWPQFE